MAARKTRKASVEENGGSIPARQVAVMLEDIRSQFRVFGEALQGFRESVDARFTALGGELRALRVEMHERFAQVDQRFEQVDQRFAQVDQRFAQVDQRFAQVDQRFERIDGRLEQADGRFDRLDRELGLVKAAVTQHSHELRELRETEH